MDGLLDSRGSDGLFATPVSRSSRDLLQLKKRKEYLMAKSSSRSSGKPSKAALSKAGRTLASDSSSKTAKSKAGSTLGKG